MKDRIPIALSRNANGDFDVSVESIDLFIQALTNKKIAESVKAGELGSGILFAYDDNKFKTCCYRSNEVKYQKASICCGEFIEISGYECQKKKIFNILAQDCYNCNEYKPTGI